MEPASAELREDDAQLLLVVSLGVLAGRAQPEQPAAPAAPSR